MVCTKTTQQAAPEARSQGASKGASEEVVRGYTLPSLLNDACVDTPNPHAFNQWTEAGWQPLSNQAFRTAVESLALGLVELGLKQGDRVALLMHSDIHFCIADLGCLLANLVDVPIDLTQTLEHIIFVLRHSEAKVLIISNLDLLTQIAPYLENTALQQIIIATVPDHWTPATASTSKSAQSKAEPIPETACLDVPMLLHPVANHPAGSFPCHLPVYSLAAIQTKGQEVGPETESRLQQLHANLQPSDLATIVYIPDEHGQPQGVMLTHENLSANALTSFAVIPGLRRSAEVVLSFLPLNHVLARTLLYGHISQGYSIYFSNPNHVMKHLQQVHPTILVTVPLLLEKIYSKILETSQKSGSVLEQVLLRWALALARQYELGNPPRGVYALQLRLADWLVFAKWRALFGGQLTYLICGGATLRTELANQFAAAGLPIMNGYGLTQASAVVCCNRGELNRAGTVGTPIPGAEVKIADDGEILIRGPYVTPGYYKNPAATQAAIDPEGWLHTGDLGQFTTEGFLQLTGLKKTLFKLSTGKYIAPQPIEQRLNQSPFVSEAIIVGADQKFCAALLVPNLEALHSYALEVGLNLPAEELLKHPCVLALYQAVVNMANCHLPYWATVKRFRLLPATVISAAVEGGSLTSSLTTNRSQTLQALADEITALFAENPTRTIKLTSSKRKHRGFFKPKQSPVHEPMNEPVHESVDEPIEALCPTIPVTPCPVVAQSLNPRLTTLRSVVPFLLGTGINLPDLPSRIAKLTAIF
ncbi:long-chain fatty acid--CoA ligase [Leptolyngbya sp. NK1-12]|uniref:Long-chain fatty acid--CoA ligase n=1 Tax=Leptolyngbya sp. NK1-12 TaxID=2547451 RepID=A0AA96WKZ9_9CYAN|nr:long-chain fatty acid--CoA ligase [Leptolyngbya sp. NK1-12]WNZ27388.1 long-chain fatty acid--CoA ligase [Leptolyngbya sp. NK1-12]